MKHAVNKSLTKEKYHKEKCNMFIIFNSDYNNFLEFPIKIYIVHRHPILSNLNLLESCTLNSQVK